MLQLDEPGKIMGQLLRAYTAHDAPRTNALHVLNQRLIGLQRILEEWHCLCTNFHRSC